MKVHATQVLHPQVVGVKAEKDLPGSIARQADCSQHQQMTSIQWLVFKARALHHQETKNDHAV
jgi:hypothetical protein